MGHGLRGPGPAQSCRIRVYGSRGSRVDRVHEADPGHQSDPHRVTVRIRTRSGARRTRRFARLYYSRRLRVTVETGFFCVRGDRTEEPDPRSFRTQRVLGLEPLSGAASSWTTSFFTWSSNLDLVPRTRDRIYSENIIRKETEQILMFPSRSEHRSTSWTRSLEF
ncbi:uncharacterized protein V6R79_021993 [Siganus canaliculatus]